jgi:membrane associated rhomboid family serine protease
LKKQAYPILIVLLVMWLVWIVDAVIPFDFNQWGLRPRTLTGLIGIALMPFLHSGLNHLIANTVPMAILLGLMVASRHRAWLVIVAIIVGNGILLWLFGRNAYHVGASGLVFGLIAYLITVGFREKQFVSMAVALVVGFLFGATLLSGVLPSFVSNVSWDGHLCGAISGLIVGIWTTRSSSM